MFGRAGRIWGGAIALALCAPPAGAVDDPFPFETGAVVGAAEAERLRSWLPAPFFRHRDSFLYDGMQMEIGPAHRDYSPPAVYQQATERHRGEARLGPEGELIGYRAGQPFPMQDLDCEGDPEAGAKVIWNFVHRWEGFGHRARFRYTYWDRGEKRSLYYRGATAAWFLKHRPEPRYQETDGDVFPEENRAVVIRFDLEDPQEIRGTRSLTYRYEKSFGPLEQAKPEDTWIFLRDLRRVRKISQTQRNTAVAGTDFSFDDLFSFSGLPPQYEWTCLGEAEVLAPMNTQVLGYPYRDDERFGPTGLSYSSDRWELRRAVRLEMRPRDPDHPYGRKEIWLDHQTLDPLYSFAYDRQGELWKIIYHVHRWSEDDLGEIKASDWYAGWEEVPRPRDLRVVSDAIVNVQTGTGNRLDFWDSHGTPPRLRDLRYYIDVTRLGRGR